MAPRRSFGRGASHAREVPVPTRGVRIHPSGEGQPRRDPSGTRVRPGPEPREGAGPRGARARGRVRSSRDRAGRPARPAARVPGVPNPRLGPGGHVSDPEVRSAEAIAAEGRLESESDDFAIHMAGQLAMDLRREDGGFRLHFTDFLRFTNTMRDAPWKLINQRVDRGYVILQRAKALRAMRHAIHA